jgi:RHS repeat-associated protein
MVLNDASGNVVDPYDYDVFGALRATTGTQPNSFTYTGEQTDTSTGLQYLRARYYDPAVGRFIGRDPLAGLIGAPSTLNRYADAFNNPVRLTDPAGLSPTESNNDCWDLDSALQCLSLQVIPVPEGSLSSNCRSGTSFREEMMRREGHACSAI